MKFRRLEKWDDVENSQSLIFFSQVLDELIFDFTLDSYKPLAMNSSLLISEAMKVFKSISKGVIKKPNLRHVLDELCVSLNDDVIIKSVLSDDLREITNILKNPNSTGVDVASCLSLLKTQVPIDLYKKRNEELLISCIMSGDSFYKINRIAKSYVTTLLNSGYTSHYIRNVTHNYFNYGDNRIAGNSAIEDFLSFFSCNKENYVVIYKAPEYFSKFEDSARKFNIVISGQMSDFNEAIKNSGFNLDSNSTYLCVKCKAREHHAAKKEADIKFDQLQTLIGLYHHKKSPKPIAKALVICEKTNVSKVLSVHQNPMHKCKDSKPGAAARKLNLFIDGFSMETASFLKFNRSAELHALALGSDSVENQIINLWIALETIVPSGNEENTSQIENISNSVMPFLTIGYVNKIVKRFSEDCLLWRAGVFKEIIKHINGNSDVEKVYKLLALDGYKDERERLVASFDDFHLLQYRYNCLLELFSSPTNIVQALESHSIRVKWQIRRIYRARNTIVHDGTTPSYADILIENIHDYLDSVLSTLMELASKKFTSNTIEEGFMLVNMRYSAYIRELKKKGITFKEDNIKELLVLRQI